MDAVAPAVEAVQEAVALLTSIGVQGLCLAVSSNLTLEASDHHHHDQYGAFLPPCGGEYADDCFRIQGARGLGVGVGDYFSVSRRLEEVDLATGDRVFSSVGEVERFYAFNIIGVAVNLLFVAILAGLYLGLLTLDVLDLEILQRTSNDKDEIKYAAEIIPMVKERHQLLVTLLLVDTVAYEALPIFLETLIPSWVAVLLSSTLILLFGEIIPTGIFTGSQQLYFAYTAAPMVKFFMWLLSPISKPIARLLDYLTQEGEDGEHDEAYNRDELSALVRIQYEQRTKLLQKANTQATRRHTINDVFKYQRNESRQWIALKAEMMDIVNERHNDDNSNDDDLESMPPMKQLTPPLHSSKVDMVEGALSPKTKLAMDVYTPFSHVFSIPQDLILDKKSITEIFSEGYSRVPVYQRKTDDQSSCYENNEGGFKCLNYLGFLMTRQLMLIDGDDERPVHTLYLQRPTCVSPRMNLVDLLRVLQRSGQQMAFVCARPDLANRALKAEVAIPDEAGVMGTVTLVDIMEAILQGRIYDEEDMRDRDRAIYTLQKWAATKLQSFLRKRVVRRRSKSPVRRRRKPIDGHSSNSTTSGEYANAADESTPLLILSLSPEFQSNGGGSSE
eukprot:CAMPEP_0198153350 /NCGR_PEP_ID=MMETSP1443-20131203/63766_1 /TAXON_ID=186043 /ORGANISM="Entomoneis sp., Strain CCMP2396" /LENGTH=615 /DNA_ID=CAMNT_0043819661 /DNA_START=247 /DNA_END=2091 /DNA_ORIENTATION=-